MRLLDNEFRVIRPYLDLRYGHRPDAERRDIRRRMIRTLKVASPEERSKFVADVEAFLARNTG